jgi:hypothetical protein
MGECGFRRPIVSLAINLAHDVEPSALLSAISISGLSKVFLEASYYRDFPYHWRVPELQICAELSFHKRDLRENSLHWSVRRPRILNCGIPGQSEISNECRSI